MATKVRIITRTAKPWCKPIPIAAAKRIAEEYGYDQVVIYGRTADRLLPATEKNLAPVRKGGEHMTTYGATKAHCGVAARIGDHLKRVMGWKV